MFWVFHLNRHFARIIMQHGGRMALAITRLMALNDELETAIGPIQPVFCHNDIVAANILDDGERYWLVNWEFGGWNDGLHDLVSLAANLDLEAEVVDDMLRRYLHLRDEEPNQASRRRFKTWKCAALIWAGLWGGVGEMFANLDRLRRLQPTASGPTGARHRRFSGILSWPANPARLGRAVYSRRVSGRSGTAQTSVRRIFSRPTMAPSQARRASASNSSMNGSS